MAALWLFDSILLVGLSSSQSGRICCSSQVSELPYCSSFSSARRTGRALKKLLADVFRNAAVPSTLWYDEEFPYGRGLLLCSRPYLINELKLQHLLHDRRKVYSVCTSWPFFCDISACTQSVGRFEWCGLPVRTLFQANPGVFLPHCDAFSIWLE